MAEMCDVCLKLLSKRDSAIDYEKRILCSECYSKAEEISEKEDKDFEDIVEDLINKQDFYRRKTVKKDGK